MHILIPAVSSARQPSGICRHAANLATCLSKEAAIERVTLLVGRWQADYFRNAFGLRSTAVKVRAVDLENNAIARNWWYYRLLPTLAQQHRADTVHLAFPVPVRRESFSCPVLCSLHDLYPYDSPRNFGYVRVLFNRMFLRQCLAASDAIVCSSDFTLRRLRQCVPKIPHSKTVRIYQSVTFDPDKSRAPARSESAGPPFLLTVAQHRRNKNLHLLLTAFAELRAQERLPPRLRMVIVGAAGPETSRLNALVQRLSLQNHVQFESALMDAELCWLYQKCELMIAPSSVEGFCLPVVEALHCGCRVLCSDIPVLREVSGHHCRYFRLDQPRPASALAQAISDALLEPAIAPFISDRFSPRKIAREHLALYFRLATGRREVTCSALALREPVQYDRYAR